jgi:hypothetical protein
MRTSAASGKVKCTEDASLLAPAGFGEMESLVSCAFATIVAAPRTHTNSPYAEGKKMSRLG